MADVPTIETLSAVVDGHSRQFEALHKEVADVGRRVETLFSNLADKLDAQRTSVSEEQRRAVEQQLTLLASNRPDYKGLISVGVATVGLLISAAVVIGSMAIGPLREQIADLKSNTHEAQALQQNRNLALAADTEALSKQIVEARLSLAKMDGEGAERHDQYLRDAARAETRDNVLETLRVNRPEVDKQIAGVTETVNRLSTRMTEMQHEFGMNFTLGDAVKEMQARLNALQLQTNTSSAVAPPSHPAD